MATDKEVENSENSENSENNKPRRQRHSLGRGLDALFLSKKEQITNNSNLDNKLKNINISDIYPHAGQPRHRFVEKELKELAQSIVDQGILQPLLVRIDKNNTNTERVSYKIIAGERRWRAAQIAGLHVLPAIILDINDEEVLKVSLIENIQRSSLSYVEEAKGLQTLLDDFNHTQESLARVVGKSRSHIANTLRILTLSEKILLVIEENNISIGHARNFVGLDDKDIITLIKDINDKGLSVRECERIVAKNKFKNLAKKDDEIHLSNKRIEVGEIEEKLGVALGFKVNLKLSANGKGSVRLFFDKPKDLNRLIDLLLSKQAV